MIMASTCTTYQPTKVVKVLTERVTNLTDDFATLGHCFL